MMSEGTTRNKYSSLEKYNKLYLVASRWMFIDIDTKGTDAEFYCTLQNRRTTNMANFDDIS